MPNEKNKLVKHTQEFFLKFYDDQLSDEDAIEIINTLRDYSKALLDIAGENNLNSRG